MTFNQIAGVLPAIVFPAATLFQLLRMLRSRTAADVSVSTWLLFGFANLAIYFYAERYTEWQAIAGMLVTAVLDFIIVAVALSAFRQRRFGGRHAQSLALEYSPRPSVEAWYPAL